MEEKDRWLTGGDQRWRDAYREKLRLAEELLDYLQGFVGAALGVEPLGRLGGAEADKEGDDAGNGVLADQRVDGLGPQLGRDGTCGSHGLVR